MIKSDTDKANNILESAFSTLTIVCVCLVSVSPFLFALINVLSAPRLANLPITTVSAVITPNTTVIIATAFQSKPISILDITFIAKATNTSAPAITLIDFPNLCSLFAAASRFLFPLVALLLMT